MSEIDKIQINGEIYSIQDITSRQRIEGILNSDYTAFEVFAHDYDILDGGEYTPVNGDTLLINDNEYVFNGVKWLFGTKQYTPVTNDTLVKNDVTYYYNLTTKKWVAKGYSEDLGGYICATIPAQMSHKFIVRSTISIGDIDVVVDWGDGTVQRVADISEENIGGSVGNYRYILEHTYSKNGKYIVKVFGKDYYGFIHSSVSTDPNILCRILDHDLPLASHIHNLSSFAKGSLHLINVNGFRCKNLHNNRISNTAIMFSGCLNLAYILSFPNLEPFSGVDQMIERCNSLADVSIYPTTHLNTYAMYRNNYSAFDIADVLSTFNPTPGSSVKVNQMFYKCAKMTGTVPANKLWGNTDIVWKDTTQCFTGCSDAIRAQVPVSWGGTASDDIIEKSFAEKYTQLLSRIENLQSSINN